MKLLWIPFRSLSRFYHSSPSFQLAVPSLLSEYRNTNFTLQDGMCEWKGNGGLLFLHKEEVLMGMLQMKKYTNFWELSSFVINPLYQGQGHGRRMLEGILQTVDSPVCLRVKQGNSAYKLYESVGFQTESLGDGRYYMKCMKSNPL